MLFEELALSIQNDRPSILLAPYASEFLRVKVEKLLGQRLAGIHQKVVQMAVQEDQFDLPLLLSRRPDRHTAVYSIRHLSEGGGKEDANAYRALNIRRELLVDQHIRCLFWLTGTDGRDLSRHAPDFWAFRHRVIEFNRPGDINRLSLSTVPHPYAAIRLARKHAHLSKEKANSWLELGDLSLVLGLLSPARRAFLKSLAIDPRSASGWLGLGNTYRLGENYSDAIINYRHVLQLDPQNLSAHIALISCYRLTGLDDLADGQTRLAQPLVEQGNEYQQAAFASVCGNSSRAVDWLSISLKKQQVYLDQLERDPNMDTLRDDPGFQRLFTSPFGEVAGGVKAE